jgi:hypothetical protein
MNSHFIHHTYEYVKDAWLTTADVTKGWESLVGGAARISLPLCELAGPVEKLPLPSEGPRPIDW